MKKSSVCICTDLSISDSFATIDAVVVFPVPGEPVITIILPWFICIFLTIWIYHFVPACSIIFFANWFSLTLIAHQVKSGWRFNRFFTWTNSSKLSFKRFSNCLSVKLTIFAILSHFLFIQNLFWVTIHWPPILMNGL